MKSLVNALVFVLVILSVCAIVGCGSKESPVVAEPPQADVQVIGNAPAKELTIAEREALFAEKKKIEEAKQKADAFYKWFDSNRLKEKLKDRYTDTMDEILEKAKNSPDFVTWGKDALRRAEIYLDGPPWGYTTGVREDYDYLSSVFPELLREKTDSARLQVKQELDKIRAQYMAKYDECKHLLEPIREALRTARMQGTEDALRIKTQQQLSK
jgi:ElaB/YqjD/DUF883 family membrane-anchored ribosome-binding protein